MSASRSRTLPVVVDDSGLDRGGPLEVKLRHGLLDVDVLVDVARDHLGIPLPLLPGARRGLLDRAPDRLVREPGLLGETVGPRAIDREELLRFPELQGEPSAGRRGFAGRDDMAFEVDRDRCRTRTRSAVLRPQGVSPAFHRVRRLCS
jgi:hypothetical protein